MEQWKIFYRILEFVYEYSFGIPVIAESDQQIKIKPLLSEFVRAV
jgi:hypothetical protein